MKARKEQRVRTKNHIIVKCMESVQTKCITGNYTSVTTSYIVVVLRFYYHRRIISLHFLLFLYPRCIFQVELFISLSLTSSPSTVRSSNFFSELYLCYTIESKC